MCKDLERRDIKGQHTEVMEQLAVEKMDHKTILECVQMNTDNITALTKRFDKVEERLSIAADWLEKYPIQDWVEGLSAVGKGISFVGKVAKPVGILFAWVLGFSLFIAAYTAGFFGVKP